MLLRMLARTNPDRASALCGAVARRVGPWLPAHRIGQQNLRAAFPDRDAVWIEATLRDAWENLGRVAGEYVHLGRLWDYDQDHPNTGRIESEDEALFRELLDDGKPALCFTAHLGNWELPAVMAAAHGLPSAVVYRMPNNRAVAREIARIRAPLMGRLIRTRPEAALEMAAALDPRRSPRHAGGPAVLPRGGRHVLRPALQGQSDDRAPGASVRLSGCRGAGDPPAPGALSADRGGATHSAPGSPRGGWTCRQPRN